MTGSHRPPLLPTRWRGSQVSRSSPDGYHEVALSLPAVVACTIVEAKVVSEAEANERKAENLWHITVNTGRIEGGIGVSIIPDRARALCAIHIPPG